MIHTRRRFKTNESGDIDELIYLFGPAQLLRGARVNEQAQTFSSYALQDTRRELEFFNDNATGPVHYTFSETSDNDADAVPGIIVCDPVRFLWSGSDAGKWVDLDLYYDGFGGHRVRRQWRTDADGLLDRDIPTEGGFQLVHGAIIEVEDGGDVDGIFLYDPVEDANFLFDNDTDFGRRSYRFSSSSEQGDGIPGYALSDKVRLLVDGDPRMQVTIELLYDHG